MIRNVPREDDRFLPEGDVWIRAPGNLLNWCSIKLLRLFGLKADIGHDRPHSPEEIVMIVRQAQQVGHFDKQDVDMIEGVMEFTEKRARDVMTPRTDVVDLTELHRSLRRSGL